MGKKVVAAAGDMPAIQVAKTRIVLFLAMAGIVAVSTLAPVYAFGQGYSYKRNYAVGTTLIYALTTDTYYNGKFTSQSIATSRHTVVNRNGVPFEKVTFTGMKERRNPKNGAFTSLGRLAREVKPFYISLAPRGTVDIPKLTVPQMTGPITDLITYWVALGPRIGIDRLHEPGESLTVAKPFAGTWADGGAIPVGRDETTVAEHLVADSASTATFMTSFLPPVRSAFSMAYPWMRKPVVAATPNNFEQIQAAGNGRYNVMWGNERFVIRTVVDRSTGSILHATMVNNLKLRLRVHCNATFKTCGPEFPFAITRKETLELVSK